MMSVALGTSGGRGAGDVAHALQAVVTAARARRMSGSTRGDWDEFPRSESAADTGYDECWKVTQQVSYTSYWIYCRGIGLVTYEIVDLAGGTIHAELQSKSF